ncbi:hypothetical protein [Actinomycetospora sp. NBRC 106378]|uniref:hypothetical protein n=1 Tax=Actinomycetospora sp. NBRC 106378 TaxID=3032208 RepID=UPI0024A17223|nr:hypothetical protein [Actinomycetospora sp. NBRC 106378]GLZ55268.1 hypothetical protein Acsp07_48850 [Actinomycetospora sp. NBRC 106378]
MGSDNRARRAQRSRDKTREVRRARRTAIEVDELELDDVEQRVPEDPLPDPLGR